jgi:hypothetical protein
MDSRLRGNDRVFGDGCVTIKGARSSDARAKKTAFQFSDKDQADMTYSIDGKLSYRKITRFGF